MVKLPWEIRIIVEEAARIWGVRVEDIMGERRLRTHARPRQAAAAVARRLTDFSLLALGAAFQRDHSTIQHAVQVVEAADGEFAAKTAQLEASAMARLCAVSAERRLTACGDRDGDGEPKLFGYADVTAQSGEPHAHAAYDDAGARRALIERLSDEHPDGWALSLDEPSLQAILLFCPGDVRVGSWVAGPRKLPVAATVGRMWQPVIWRGGRGGAPRANDVVMTQDVGAAHFITSSITRSARSERCMLKAQFGAKPRAFAFWIFDLLGARAGDRFVDLSDGSSHIAASWAERMVGLAAPLDPPNVRQERTQRRQRGGA